MLWLITTLCCLLQGSSQTTTTSPSSYNEPSTPSPPNASDSASLVVSVPCQMSSKMDESPCLATDSQCDVFVCAGVALAEAYVNDRSRMLYLGDQRKHLRVHVDIIYNERRVSWHQQLISISHCIIHVY